MANAITAVRSHWLGATTDRRTVKAFLAAFDALPIGTFRAKTPNGRYVVSKTAQIGGRSWKLVAEELGSGDYVSLNLYRTAKGALLRPCEMPEAKVIDFVLALRPDQ